MMNMANLMPVSDINISVPISLLRSSSLVDPIVLILEV